MNLSFNEEQEALRDSARSFLAENSSSEKIRQAMESESGYDPDLWRRIGAELGWSAVVIPEEYGGLGLGPIELVALMEEMGAALLCSPFFSSICLAGGAILGGGSEAQKEEILPGIASGETIATVAYTEAGGRWDAAGIEATVRGDGSDFILTGLKTFVPDGASAGLLVVAARRDGTTGEDGVSLFLVPADTQGVEVRALPTVDQTRHQAEITLRDVRLPASSLLGAEGAGWPILSSAIDGALVALAAEQLGGAQRCLDLTVAYAKERAQFGRPIGSFQAVKHKCADMLVLIESARSAVYYAAAAQAEGDPEVPTLASLAKAYCSDAYFRCAADSIQIHGGVGFTWEYDVHLYFKRAKSSETLLGDAPFHRERIARNIGL
ncbi:MAG: acyl-CoA/acyl-ACP dehydrogenase [Candidatus Binatia bacterium]|nr:acyl-CoA/acyl-ACP dehydrogenase [Candidatus Binatia bacterium]